MVVAPHVERAAEDVGEAQDVVDLVGIIRAPGADHRVGRAAASASSGMISGLGLASARISGRGAMRLHHVRLQHAAGRQAEEDVRAVDDLGRACAPRSPGRRRAFHRSISVGAALVDDALDVRDEDVLAPRAERDQQVEAGERRRAGARGDDLDLVDASCRRARSALRTAAPTMIAVPCWSSWKTGIFMRSRSCASTSKHSGALMSSRLMPPKVGSSAATTSTSGRRPSARDLDVEHVDAGELLEQDRLALHHGLGGERPDIAEAEHGGAVR